MGIKIDVKKILYRGENTQIHWSNILTNQKIVDWKTCVFDIQSADIFQQLNINHSLIVFAEMDAKVTTTVCSNHSSEHCSPRHG